MTKTCIAYVTHEGQTAKIADYIADVIRAHGQEAETMDIKKAGTGVPVGYDGVIVGSSIHIGKHDKHATDYVKRNREALEHVPSAMFSVSLAAHGDEEEAEGYVEKFEEQTGWHPGKVAIFSGALPYTEYNFVKRHMMKQIAGRMPGNLGTDVHRDYVYTEWDGVKRFAEDFLDELTATHATTAGAPRHPEGPTLATGA